MPNETKIVVTQAQFLIGILELKRGLSKVLDLAKEGIKIGPSPDDRVPQEWLDTYQYHVRKATSQVCGSGLSHRESKQVVDKLVEDMLGSVLSKVLRPGG